MVVVIGEVLYKLTHSWFHVLGSIFLCTKDRTGERSSKDLSNSIPSGSLSEIADPDSAHMARSIATTLFG